MNDHQPRVIDLHGNKADLRTVERALSDQYPPLDSNLIWREYYRLLSDRNRMIERLKGSA